MDGRIHNVFVKDGRLILDQRIAIEVGAEPVNGDRLGAVLYAQREQIAEDERRLQATGDIDDVVMNHKNRVKAAMQAALTKYDTENPND